MSRVLIINSSFRKKSTYSLLKRIESLFESDSVEFLNIKDFDIKPCIGCENCLRKGICNIKDSAGVLLDKMSSAEGIIIGTPVYLRQISGYLKMLIDRGCSWYHRSPLVGKPIFFVTATQVSGSKQAMKYLNDLSVQWGTINTGFLSRTMFSMNRDFKNGMLKKFNYYLKETNKRKYRPSLKQLIEFHTQKVLAIHVLPLDKEYWTQKDYLDKAYYYPCKINPFNRLIGFLYFKMLSYIIGKNKAE